MFEYGLAASTFERHHKLECFNLHLFQGCCQATIAAFSCSHLVSMGGRLDEQRLSHEVANKPWR